MDRRSIIKNVGIAGVLAAGVAPAVHARAAIRWRLASSFPKSLDTIFGAADVFAKKVSDMSGGKFTISIHAGGELMPALGVVDGVQNGTVEMAHTAPYYFHGKDETFALGCAIPFGLNSRQMTAWMYEGNGMKLMREFYAKNIPGGEIYQALEKGTIDAAEWVGPYDDQKLGFNKVAPFYHYPGWWEGGPQLDFFINDKAFNTLSAENKVIVECAAAFAHTEMQAKYDARNPNALKQLVGNKTKVLPFPKDVLELAFKESMALYAEVSAKNPNWKKVYDDYAAFRKDQNLWFQFTEMKFDSFMQSQLKNL